MLRRPTNALALLLGVATVSTLADRGAPGDRYSGSDGVHIEEIEVEFPNGRLVYWGEVHGTPAPPDLSSEDIASLEVTLRPLLDEVKARDQR